MHQSRPADGCAADNILPGKQTFANFLLDAMYLLASKASHTVTPDQMNAAILRDSLPADAVAIASAWQGSPDFSRNPASRHAEE